MWDDDPFTIRMRERCLQASEILQFDPACNMSRCGTSTKRWHARSPAPSLRSTSS